LISVGTAVPPNVLSRDAAKDFARRFFGPAYPDIERRLSVFDNACIDTRWICVPLDWFQEPRPVREKNAVYAAQAVSLGALAATRCLERAGVSGTDVTEVVFVSTTGLATPSPDAALIPALSLSPDTPRTPVWGLGCAGGVAGVAHAARLAAGRPRARVLVVAVELCSVTFHFGDRSMSNLVASALFGDGAAAVLVAGDDAETGPEIVGAGSHLFPDSRDVMGWNFDEAGMQVVFTRAIPGIIAREAAGDIGGFLERNGFTLDAVDHFIAHPGGVKVLAAYERALSLAPETMAAAREVLRTHGNMSSASVLFVLERFLHGEAAAAAGSLGLMTALGPGFSSEKVLLRF
jgi:alkylresorcinol/alkylpyrone synthase